jgi:hypothetical protein
MGGEDIRPRLNTSALHWRSCWTGLPAGNGIHRVHAARIWRLPYVLAIVQVERLLTPIGPRPAGDLSQLWEGLQQRELIEADVVGQYWYLRSATAEWMLTRPSLATVMNGTYERLYSGALQKANGMTIHELTESKKWEGALKRGTDTGRAK